MTFAEKLKKLRTQYGLTQMALADRSGVSYGIIGLVESGARVPSKETAKKLATFFNVSADYFLFESNDQEPQTSISADTLFDILDVVDKFLAENHLYMEPKQRRLVVKHFYEQNLHDPARIKETLSALRAVNGEIFTKGK